MLETKYTTRIYLAVRDADTDAAGKTAVHVYQDFLARLRRNAPTVKGLRLELDPPAERKEDAGVFACWSSLLGTVPHDLAVLGANNHRDAWRTILKRTLTEACYRNHDRVFHAASRVEVTRELLPSDEAPVVAAPKDETPKELIAIKVTLGGQVFDVQIPKGENLLDGVNDKGVAVKWDCKSGVCDTCKVQIVKGNENLSEPNEAEKNMLGDLLAKGYRLSCQVTANGPCELKQ